MRVHRYPWWHDGDQDFLSEWVDPSGSLDFVAALRLRHELFGPIVRQIPARFAYQGPSRDYFMRAVDDQVDLASDRRLLRTLGMWHLWRGLTEETGYAGAHAVASDIDLAEAARGARAALLREKKIDAPEAVLEGLLQVPRERFVRVEDIPMSADDRALNLDDSGASTISAMHAYAASFAALSLTEGDELVDLGGGTGYGAAI